MAGGTRGAVAWEDDASSWDEYGNPHSTMGEVQSLLLSYRLYFTLSNDTLFIFYF
jgi:hypothetical protein